MVRVCHYVRRTYIYALAGPAKVIAELRSENARLRRALNQTKTAESMPKTRGFCEVVSHHEEIDDEDVSHGQGVDNEHTPDIGETHRFTERYEELRP